LIGALLLYGNASAWLDNRRGEIPTRFNWAHMAMLALSVAWGLADRVSMHDVGITCGGARKSAALGSALGVGGLLATRFCLAHPLVGQRIGLPNFEPLAGAKLAKAVFLQFLLGSAVFEEVAFRGVLRAQLMRSFGPSATRIIGSGVFALWHGMVVWYNLRRLNPPRPLVPVLYSGVLGVLFGVGMVLCHIRDATGHLAGGVITHWLLVAGMVLAIPRRRGHSEAPTAMS
jgi:membrane protease YdiL (CAAX protease family)